MYVWAAFEAKSPPTRQDLATLISNYTLYVEVIKVSDIIMSVEVIETTEVFRTT